MTKIAIYILFSYLSFAQGTTSGGTGNIGGTTSNQTGSITVSSIVISPASQSQNVSQTIGFSATATFSNGQSGDITTSATWNTSNSAIASLFSLTATENVKCVSVGTVQISASYGGTASGSTPLACIGVLPPTPTLVSITVAPNNPSVAVGQSVAMTATGTFSDGSTQNITATSAWTSGTPSKATVGPLTTTEAVNCIAGGTSVITATSGVISGNSTLTCNAVLSSIAVTPASPSIVAGTGIGFIATGTYSDGSKQDVTTTSTWGSSSTSIASLGALTTQQSVNGLSAGSSTISATVGSVSGNTTLTVTSPGPPPPTLSSITVTPSIPTVNVNSLLGFKATGHYSDGSNQDVTSSAIWTSGTPATATVQAAANPQNVKCIANGTSVITAAVGAVNGNTTLTCQTPAPTLSSIAVTPVNQTQYNGSTVQFTATGTYSDGSTQNLTSQATWSSGTPAVATIGASTGLATCVANSGTTVITATVSSVSGNTNLSCQPASTNVGGNAYCNPNGTWIGSTVDGPANLPVNCMMTAVSNTPSPGAIRGPDMLTSQVQADLTAAACGDTILVQAGSTLGSLVFPNKGCVTTWITVKSTGVSNGNFPVEGTRMTPCWSGVASMPGRPAYPCPSPQVLTFKMVAPNGGGAMTTTNGDHYRIIGAEITRPTTGGLIIFNLVDLSSTGVQPNHFIFDRVWFHGVPGTFPSASTATDTSTTRAIYLGQSNHIAVIDSYFSDFYDTSSRSANGQTDAQCVGGGFGSIANSGWGVYKFVNNHCEASGEGILLGGSNGPALTPGGCTVMVNCTLDAPTDLEVRGNYFFKPPQWDGNTTTVAQTGWPVVKNGFEMKTGARALFEGNVIENCWYSAQVCYSFSIAPINQQSGGSSPVPTCPTCVVQDFTYRYNYSYNVAYGIGLYAFAPTTCSQCVSQGANGVSVHDNLIGDDLNLGSLTSINSGDEMEIMAIADPSNLGRTKLQNINLSHNTFVKGIRTLTIFGGGPAGQMTNFTFQNNIWAYATYGFGIIGNPNGCDTPFGFTNNAFGILNACVTTYTWDHDAVFNWNGGTLGSKWPTNGSGQGNFFYGNALGPGFTNYGTGDSSFNPSNYQLTSSSPLHNAGSDGKDIGADIVTLQQKIAGVRQ